MRLNEKALDDFCQSLVDYCLPDISVFMSALFISWKATGTRARREDLAATRSQYSTDYDDYDSSLETAIDHDNYLEFQRFYLTSARHWKRALCWKISCSTGA